MSVKDTLAEIQLLHPDFKTFTYGRWGLSFQQYYEETLISVWTPEEFNPRSRTRILMEQLFSQLVKEVSL